MSEGEIKSELEQPFSKVPMQEPSDFARTNAQIRADVFRAENKEKAKAASGKSVLEQAEAVVRGVQLDKLETDSKGPDLVFSSTRVHRPDGSFYNPQAGKPEARPILMPDTPRNSFVDRAITRLRNIIKK